MTLEEQIKRLETVNTRLEKEKRELQRKYDAMIKSHDSYSRDRWYIAYLQVELMRLESQYSNRQEQVEELLAMNRKLKNVTESFTVDNV